MDTKKLAYFLRLHENGNITHTAKEAFLTQSALTKMIQGWEEEFHCKLLTRSRKGVRFTREGELFVTLCQQVLALEKTFREDVSSAADELTGSITIGVSLNYMSRHFPTILRRFTQTYPRVHLTVIDSHSEKLYSDLLNHKLDIAIVRGDYKWFDTKILLDSEPFCLVSCHPLTEETLCQEPYVGHRTDMDTKFSIDRWFFEKKLTVPDAALWLGSIDACRDVIQEGFGWSILPKICLTEFQGNLAPMTFQDGTPFLCHTYALISHGESTAPHVQAFLEALMTYHKIL